MASAPFNEFQFINSNLANISNNNVGISRSGTGTLPATTVTTFYQTSTFLNAMTGQTEIGVALIQS